MIEIFICALLGVGITGAYYVHVYLWQSITFQFNTNITENPQNKALVEKNEFLHEEKQARHLCICVT